MLHRKLDALLRPLVLVASACLLSASPAPDEFTVPDYEAAYSQAAGVKFKDVRLKAKELGIPVVVHVGQAGTIIDWEDDQYDKRTVIKNTWETQAGEKIDASQTETPSFLGVVINTEKFEPPVVVKIDPPLPSEIDPIPFPYFVVVLLVVFVLGHVTGRLRRA